MEFMAQLLSWCVEVTWRRCATTTVTNSAYRADCISNGTQQSENRQHQSADSIMMVQ